MPNQDFINFISVKDDKKTYGNLGLLLNLEMAYPGIFIKTMSDFDSVKLCRDSIDKNGKPIKVNWKEALIKFYINNKYHGITKDNEDIAKVFGAKGIPQEIFNKAYELRKKARQQNVQEHILGSPLKEDSIIESIEKIKEKTNEELKNGREIIDELYDKQFTYEWLSKHDPKNSIIGLYCGCCATITNFLYGGVIAKASVTSHDIQNLVVKNSKGEIISKGAMYINKKRGYCVINEFDLNEKYRNHEACAGRYKVNEDSPEEKDRELIFKAFQRGIGAFIEKYDKQNPEKPIQQVNIGMGFNRLKRQVERFEKAKSHLDVPEEYFFRDASENQYILYKREEKEIENGGNER